MKRTHTPDMKYITRNERVRVCVCVCVPVGSVVACLHMHLDSRFVVVEVH